MLVILWAFVGPRLYEKEMLWRKQIMKNERFTLVKVIYA